jgi:hypothetical protein
LAAKPNSYCVEKKCCKSLRTILRAAKLNIVGKYVD